MEQDQQIIHKARKLGEKLIAIPSTADNPEELRHALDIAKMELQGFAVEEFEGSGIPSVLISGSSQKLTVKRRGGLTVLQA